jgi:hypothetical protein
MLKKLLVVLATTMLMSACASEPPPAPPPPPPPPQPQSFMVFFDWDRSNLSSQAVQTIQQAAAAFKSRGAARITATGHTDTSGPEAYNMALSLRRANAVKQQLVRDGVPDQAIQVIGRGEAGLLVQTADGVREPQNRRVEIVIDGGQSVTTVTYVTTDPLSYCRALSQVYRRNISNSNADAVAGAALAECEAGQTDKGIPTLERLLTDAKIPLPKRQY